MEDNKKMRVRFAPSPTGPFHIGGARSALFNWLLAKKYNGVFVLRIEDTDLDRSKPEFEENIKNALKWLGITWDEGIDVGGEFGPYRQTERLAIYKKYTDELLAKGAAYKCYCSEEELDQVRQDQLEKGETPKYSGKCSKLTKEEQAELEKAGRKYTIRLKVPANKQIMFKDMVRGTVSFESNGVGDFVIVKSDGVPVYNYAVVLDDALMQITHVIRAEEHLSNTPRQILIYEALGFELPEFGHISLILGKDRSKMSKRHGATSVDQYRKLGYLREGLINFLALLGWSPEGEEEIFTVDEIIEQFSMDRVAKNPAVFDIDKLNHINAQYMKNINPEHIMELGKPYLVEAGYINEVLTEEEKIKLLSICTLLRPYLSFAAQLVEHAGIFYNKEVAITDEEMLAILNDEEVKAVLKAFYAKIATCDKIEPALVQTVLKSITKELKVGGKKVFMPIRIVLTGQMHGPDLTESVTIIGKETTLARVEDMLKKL